MGLTAINLRWKRSVPGISRDDGWWICAGGLGAIVLAIHRYPMGFGRVFDIAEGVLIAMTGLRFATKAAMELWIAYSWLSSLRFFLCSTRGFSTRITCRAAAGLW
jgi:hypothetical protein